MSVAGGQVVPFFALFFNILLIPFSKVKSQIDRQQKDSLGKSYEKKTFVSEFVILVARKKRDFWVLATHC